MSVFYPLDITWNMHKNVLTYGASLDVPKDATGNSPLLQAEYIVTYFPYYNDLLK